MWVSEGRAGFECGTTLDLRGVKAAVRLSGECVQKSKLDFLEGTAKVGVAG